MRLNLKIAPGLKIRLTSRGVRTSMGPRAARVHFGAGGTGFSTGIGPVSAYKPAGGRRRRTTVDRPRTSAATSERQFRQVQDSPRASRPGQPLGAPLPPPRRPSPGRGTRRSKNKPRRVAGAVAGAFVLLLIIIAIATGGGHAKPTGSASAAATSSPTSSAPSSRPSTAHAKKKKVRPHRVSAPVRATTPTPTATAAAVAPPPAPSATPTGCYPLSNEGTCYEPGEYCRNANHGASGVAGDGEAIICEDHDGWRWEPT